ncbi:hypothetical protein ACQ86N_32575 [Puia sp. P3]|uniref:hypothetical protein n=1 Tax=Puia sp. P3 TaxID=3423952 RepID=UPI003D666169
MKDGRKLLSELAALSPVPVYVRCHNLLTTGDGVAAMKLGVDECVYGGCGGEARV